MQRIVVTCGALILAVAALAGCGPDPEVVAQREREEQWQGIEQTHQQLTAKRAELEQALEQQAAAEEGAEDGAEPAGAEAAENGGEDAAGEGAEAVPDVDQLETEMTQLSDQLAQQLVEFINANPPVAGETPPERVQQAIRIKSDEDIRIAKEYIEEGGDYRQAISIYRAALEIDPEYEALQEALAWAEEMRYMTEERFARVEEGMTRDEVREAIGPVYLRNIRDYEEGGTRAVAWIYRRDEEGSAAAVWFRETGDGDYEVYEADFHFKDAGEEEEEE